MYTEKICEKCSVIDEDVVETSDGRFLCNDCAVEEGYEFCDVCCTWHPQEEMNGVRVRYGFDRICQDCCENDSDYYYCENCEEWILESYRPAVDVQGDRTVCYDCYQRNYVTCAVCGKIVPYDDAYDADDDGYWCQTCAEKRKNIKEYGYKPRPKCKGKIEGETIEFDYPEDCKELLFGLELEADWGECRYDCANELCEAHEDIYIKRDGSLSNDGMEIVTHPCTLDYHMNNLDWAGICKTLRRYGYHSHDTRCCGLHIHVGRAQLGSDEEKRDETIAKIIMLVDRHWEQLRVFSRRRRDQLEEWAAAPNINLEKLRLTEKTATEIALNSSDGRYRAVNLNNSKTIEFRLFNGSLKTTTIIAAIQLVSNLCNYAKDYDIQRCLNSSWYEIAEYNYHPELIEYCKNRGLTEVERKPYIYLNLEPKTVEGTPGKGDRVVVNCAHNSPANFLGQTGEVLEVFRDGWRNTLAVVEFDIRFNDKLYNAQGLSPENRAYIISITSLSKLA